MRVGWFSTGLSGSRGSVGVRRYVRTMLEVEAIGDLDAAGACAAVERLHAQRVRAEFALFAWAAHWADLHCGDALEDERARRGVRVRPGMERAKRAGGRARRGWRSSRPPSWPRGRGWGMSR